ncbi:MAG: tRNA (adenosine(37)-N6)-threonylcarbamoyltransferase complex ATPase subunit type 1 TsaE [gamma proteobacterium symbiont of Ctena orbiculata]
MPRPGTGRRSKAKSDSWPATCCRRSGPCSIGGARVFEIEIEGEQRQEAVGGCLALNCAPPFIVYLEGELGTGKTTLVRGFLRQLGYRGRVKSPTYTLLEPYELGGRSYYHFDLYRLSDPRELDYLGIEDLLAEDALLLIEWPDRGAGLLPQADLRIRIGYREAARGLSFSAETERGAASLPRLKEALEKV